MILIINTADVDKIEIGLADKQKLIAKKIIKAKYKQAEKLLPAVLDLFESVSSARRRPPIAGAPSILRGICVVAGPGSFSALRIGIATANALAWTLKIPVVGARKAEFKDFDELVNLASVKLKTAKAGNIVKPHYGKEPNITTAKL